MVLEIFAERKRFASLYRKLDAVVIDPRTERIDEPKETVHRSLQVSTVARHGWLKSVSGVSAYDL
jgi:hypothetical protein